MTTPSFQIQAVVGHSPASQVEKFILSTANMVAASGGDPPLGPVTLLLGTTDTAPLFSPQQEKDLFAQCAPLLQLQFLPLGPGISYTNGHNIMAQRCKADYILLCHSEAIPSPQLLLCLLAPFLSPATSTGITEARQTPFEHNKPWNATTGETPWYSSDCILIPTSLFQNLNGFDSDSFSHWGSNLDLSWRVQQAGKNIIYQPDAIVMGTANPHQPPFFTAGEEDEYAQNLDKLMLAYKWSFPQLVERLTKECSEANPNTPRQRALKAFLRRKEEGRLPLPQDAQHTVASLPEYLF